MLVARQEHDYEMRDGIRHFARDIVRNENEELLVRKSGSRSPDENPSFVPLFESRQCAEPRSGTTKAPSHKEKDEKREVLIHLGVFCARGA